MKLENDSIANTSAKTVYPILFAISFSHLLNDAIQSLIPAIYPLVKESFNLSFTQIGLITLVFQLSSSLLQPIVGTITDKRPYPFALPIGMGFSFIGLVILSLASTFTLVLFSVGLIGMGSAVFHPEASRMAHAAAGANRGMAQSIFQVGGNAGSSLGPLLAALIIAPFGRFNVIWFCFAALLAMVVLYRIGGWYKPKALRALVSKRQNLNQEKSIYPKKTVLLAVVVLLVLIFSKYFYFAGITSYYTFYLIDKFGLSIQSSQLYLFAFLFAVAVGTMAGGPIGDRIGRKYVIWASILGAAPFAIALPYANLFWTAVLSIIIGLIISSAFSAILVYAQELIPGKVGLVSGLFFGFAFGIAGVSSELGEMILSVFFIFALMSFIGSAEIERKRHKDL